MKLDQRGHCQLNPAGAWRRGRRSWLDDTRAQVVSSPSLPSRDHQSCRVAHVFSLSLRDVELILAERGVAVRHESIRHWWKKFGEEFARRLRRRRPRPGDTWHLDEVFIRIGGVQHYLWRAVDQHGVVLDILVQEKRDGAAAKRFFRRLLKGLHYRPKRLITDGLRS